MKIIAITQARTGSTRLPGKVLKEINGTTLLELHIRRILKSKMIDDLIIATTEKEEDKVITEIAKKLNQNSYRGSVDDVLDRFYQSLNDKNPDYVVRLTSDCPLIDAELIDKIIQFTIDHNLDYCSNTLSPTYPDGEDVEVFRYAALEKAWKEARLTSEREHVTPYIWKNSTFKGGTEFISDNFEEGYLCGHLRLTVDEPDDFVLISNLVSAIGSDKTWLDYANYLEGNREIKSINSSITRNEGYSKSIKKEDK